MGGADEFQVIFPPGTTMTSVIATICGGIAAALGGGTNCQVGTITANGTFVPNPTATDSDDLFDDPFVVAAIVAGGVALVGGGSFVAYKWHTMHTGTGGNAP